MSQLVCCYLACKQGGTGEGKISLHSLLFSHTPLEELARMLFTTVLALVFITVVVSTHLCVICNYFPCLTVSLFQGHVACQNFTLTAPPPAVVGTMKSIHPPEGQLTKAQMHIILLCRSLKALWGYFKRMNINNVHVWESIKDLVVKAIIA